MRLQNSYRRFDSDTRLQFHPIQLQQVVRVVVFGELLESPRLIPKLIPVSFQKQRQTWMATSGQQRTVAMSSRQWPATGGLGFWAVRGGGGSDGGSAAVRALETVEAYRGWQIIESVPPVVGQHSDDHG
jgi:hypothetical protein